LRPSGSDRLDECLMVALVLVSVAPRDGG